MRSETSTLQKSLLVLLRLTIGWHFLYEGLSKLLNPKWTAYPYLMDSKGFLSPMFHSLAENETWLTLINISNIWGLTLIGFCLIVGLLCRYACWGAMVLLCVYYLSHIPYVDVQYILPMEGSYLWIDKNVIEFFSVAVIAAFPTSKWLGLDALLCKKKRKEVVYGR